MTQSKMQLRSRSLASPPADTNKEDAMPCGQLLQQLAPTADARTRREASLGQDSTVRLTLRDAGRVLIAAGANGPLLLSEHVVQHLRATRRQPLERIATNQRPSTANETRRGLSVGGKRRWSQVGSKCNREPNSRRTTAEAAHIVPTLPIIYDSAPTDTRMPRGAVILQQILSCPERASNGSDIAASTVVTGLKARQTPTRAHQRSRLSRGPRTAACPVAREISPALHAAAAVSHQSVAALPPYAGVLNRGSTCYLAAVVQALLCSPGFFATMSLSDDCGAEQPVAAALLVLLRQLKDLQSRALVAAQLSGPEMDGQQHVAAGALTDDRRNSSSGSASTGCSSVCVSPTALLDGIRQRQREFGDGATHCAADFLSFLLEELGEVEGGGRTAAAAAAALLQGTICERTQVFSTIILPVHAPRVGTSDLY